MPNTVYKYHDKVKARLYRNRNRKNNYTKGRIFNAKSHQAFTTTDCKIILEHKLCDREIAKLLQRSVQSIQIMRSRLKKKEVK